MTLPRSSAYTSEKAFVAVGAGATAAAEATTPLAGGGRSKRLSGRYSGLAHPLAESAHVDDRSEDQERWDGSSEKDVLVLDTEKKNSFDQS